MAIRLRTMSTDKWATSKSAQLSTKVWQTAPSAWKCLKTQFWVPLTKSEPSPKAHTHSDPHLQYTHRTGQKATHGFIMACIELYVRGKNYYTEKQVFGYLWLSKKKPDTPTKTCWSQAQFQKGQPTPCKLYMLFPAHLWVREFWPQIYSLWQALDWGLLCTILASTKNGQGLECRKVNFLEYLGQGTLGWHSLFSLLFGCFSSPTFTPTAAS